MESIERGAILRREFEQVLKKAGASKSERVAAASALHPATIAGLLPLWRRVRLRWRALR
ncbi:MAG: hypothetical protein ACOH1V_03090 [Stenotrophomonas sp.]